MILVLSNLKRTVRWVVWAFACTACSMTFAAQTDSTPEQIPVDSQGTLHIPAFNMPMSALMSSQMKQALLALMRQPYPAHPAFDAPMKEWQQYWKQFDADVMEPLLKRQRARYSVEVKHESLGGVPVDVLLPADGVSSRNSNRVMINLHGGGFYTGAGPGGLVESVITAGRGKIKVVSVDYRQAPEHQFPAASEDVATVYSALLKQYPAENIGIYGCSAGGLLTGEAVVWFQKHDLPQPGAVGIFCASVTNVMLGDSNILGPILSYALMPAGLTGKNAQAPRRGRFFEEGYFSGADPNDPLVIPAASEEALAQFPATLFVTGTRATELSAAAYSHALLLKVGVDSSLYVGAGGWHGYFVDPDIPEAREAYAYILKWFDQKLGTAPLSTHVTSD